MSPLLTRLIYCVLLPAAIFLSSHSSALAEADRNVTIFTVNSLADPGSGSCDEIECTLRSAIVAASGAIGSTAIEFEEGLSGAITLGSELYINFNGLSINGPGPDVIELSGNDATRVFRTFNSDVAIRGLTIRNGIAPEPSPNAFGAGIYISNKGDVLLENLRVTNNSNANQGSGIYVSFATATIRNVEISDNVGDYGALLINGGTNHPVLIENTTISGNSGNQLASALFIVPTETQNVTLRYVTVSNNSGSARAAGIYGSGGTTHIEASIFAGNDAPSGDLVDNNGNVTINNSIIGNLDGSVTGANNLVDADAQLQPLMFWNGSVTRVHPSGDGPARDHVDNTVGNAGCGTTVTQDQIGNPRPSGLRCDAGAYESPDEPDSIFQDRFEMIELLQSAIASHGSGRH